MFDYNRVELIARRAGKNLDAVFYDGERGVAMIRTSQRYYAMGEEVTRIVRLYFLCSQVDVGLERAFEEVVLENSNQGHKYGLFRTEIERVRVVCLERN